MTPKEMAEHMLDWRTADVGLGKAVAEEYLELLKRHEAAMDALEDLYMNTSTEMPAAWNDEVSWYRSQLHSVIGRAARAHKQIDSEQA